MRIVFMGTPEFAVASLEALLTCTEHTLIGVVTNPDKPSGRGQNLSESAVKKCAVKHQIPLLQPNNLHDEEFINTLIQWNADIFVVVAFKWLPRAVWSIPSYGTINVHGSLLPQYRGAAPINRAIMNGETETGVTTFLIDKEIDTGKILLSDTLSIDKEENAGSVHDRMMLLGAQLLIRTLDGFINNNMKPQSQESFIDNTTVLKPAPKIFKDDCLIHWDQQSSHIHNQIRGLSPYPGAFTILKHNNGTQRVLKIFEAIISNPKPDSIPAGSIKIEQNHLLIACLDSYIELIDVQIDGKKRLKVDDFLRGIDINNFSI